jgi:hypothetical protein
VSPPLSTDNGRNNCRASVISAEGCAKLVAESSRHGGECALRADSGYTLKRLARYRIVAGLVPATSIIFAPRLEFGVAGTSPATTTQRFWLLA